MALNIHSLCLNQLASDPTGVEGQLIYNTTDNCVKYYDGVSWVCLEANPVSVYSALQIKNTDTTTDIATTTAAVFSELFGTTVINTTPADYTVDLVAGTITINNDGLYQISAYAAWVDTGSIANRTDVSLWVEVNGTQVSPNYQNNYMRDASGHTESGQNITSFLYQAVAGDVVEIWRQQISGNANANLVLEGTDNYLQVERLQ